MKSIESTIADTRSLDELIEARLHDLFAKLARPHTADELLAELGELNELVYSYKLRDELLEKLLDSTTPEEKRQQIMERLQDTPVKVADNRAEWERLHAKSHQLMERSMLLMQKAQEQIQKEALNKEA